MNPLIIYSFQIGILIFKRITATLSQHFPEEKYILTGYSLQYLIITKKGKYPYK